MQKPRGTCAAEAVGMRIGIQAWGSEGDIRPLLALAGGLRAAGHDVTVAVTSVNNKDYSLLSRAMDLKYIKVHEHISCDMPALLKAVLNIRSSAYFLKVLLAELFCPFVDEIYEVAKELCKTCDLVIGHFLVYPVHIAAIKSRTPFISVTLWPDLVPSSRRPSAWLPDLGPAFNRLGWKFSWWMLEMGLRKEVRRFWIKEGLSPSRHIVRDALFPETLNLIPVSPVLYEKQPSWANRHRIAGFFDLPDSAEPWTMPAGLREFLNSGEPPVYMTLGPYQGLDEEPNLRLMVSAARRANCRALIQTRLQKYLVRPSEPLIYFTGEIPHRQVFPHCAAVVHHGGMGTIHSATRAGCPSVVVAFTAEQLSWAARLRRLGIAGKALHHRRTTPRRLARSIRFVLDSPAIGKRAAELAEAMRKEDGVARAVELIERHLTPEAVKVKKG